MFRFRNKKMHSTKKFIGFLSLYALVTLVNSNPPPSGETDANKLACLDSVSHKPMPEPEEELFGECKKWTQLSCCNKTTATNIHQIDVPWQNFNYDHCFPISSECRRRFQQEICMYECDPYLGDFIEDDFARKTRSQRFYRLPLCKKDCDAWFDACKNDFTCRDVWSRGFDWSSKTNNCVDQDKCITFQEMYGKAENFCSQIWDEAFEVPSSEDKCFSFDFQDPKNNPNRETAEYYRKKFRTQ